MTAEMEAELRVEQRAWKALDGIPVVKSWEPISSEDPDRDAHELTRLNTVYTHLRALLRVPPGDHIADHYFRIYELAKG